MACKTPVIAPATPFVHEVTRSGTLARLYDWTNPRYLTSAILEQFASLGRAQEAADLAYGYLRHTYSAAASRRAMIESYANLVPSVEVLSADEVFEPSTAKSGSITWQGRQTSSTGAGSSVPTALNPQAQPQEQEHITIDFDDIEFEASGALLGGSVEKDPFLDTAESTNPFTKEP